MNDLSVKITSYVPPGPTRYTLTIEGLSWEEIQVLKEHAATVYQGTTSSNSLLYPVMYKLWHAKTP